MDQALQQEILSFIESTGNTVTELLSEKRALQEQFAAVQQEKVRLEKVAASANQNNQTKFAQEDINKALQNLKNLAIIDDKGIQKIASEIQKDSTAVFKLIDVLTDGFYKLASNSHGSFVDSSEIKDYTNKGELNEDYYWKKLASGQIS